MPQPTPTRLLALLLFLALALPAAACGGGSPAAFTVRDLDGDGVPDDVDNDLDGDGRLNQYDDDVDGDGTPNEEDGDDDGDGVADRHDETPLGPWIPAAQTLFVTSGVATVGFGDVPQGQRAGPAIVTIQNDTTSAVRIERVELTGTGAGAYAIDTSALPGLPFTLEPGDSEHFTATYDPRGATPALGRVDVDMGIGTGTFPAVVHLLGQGTAPAMTASGAPSTIHFGDVPVGVVAGPGVARLRNDTAAAWTLETIDLTGTGGDTFALDLAPLGGALPLSIPAGAEVRFHVTYAPRSGTANVGEVQVGIRNGATSRVLGLDLLGQGLAPAMTVTPAELDFGAALGGVEVVDLEIEVRNAWYGSGPLTVAAIHLPDDAGGAFSVPAPPSLPAVIPPGGAPLVFVVRFQPQAGSFGTVQGALRIDGNDPTVDVEHTVALEGRAAGWQAPATPLAGDLDVAGTPAPTWLAGSSRFVLRHAGPDGTFGGIAGGDDQIVVVDANPDGDDDTNDARVLVRWTGFALSAAPSGALVDAGNGRHVFFLAPGLDGALGGADDQLHVLDTVSGSVRSLACPNVGTAKSTPVIVDAGQSLVVVATGVGGGVFASADTLLVYRNLLGNVNAVGPDETVALEVVVPDVACCRPTPVGTRTVVMPCADGGENPDLDDRDLDDGNEGLVQVRGLLAGAGVERVALSRALAETAAPTPGDGFCRPVAVGASAVLVMTEGADPTDGTDDTLVRIDGIGTPAPAVGATKIAPHAGGLASRPVALTAGTFVFAAAGADGAYGSSDDTLMHVEADGAITLAGFGPGAALAGAGGAATRPVPFGDGVLVTTAGANGLVGDADDRVLHLDPTIAGQASRLGTLPTTGGLFAGDRTTADPLAGPRVLTPHLVAFLDRGPDAVEGTADDVLRIVRDRDGDGVLGTPADDLDADGAFTAADAVLLPYGTADGARSPLASAAGGHLLTILPGPDGVLGTGSDDQPVLWWLREASPRR